MAWTPSSLYSQNYEDLYLWRLFRDKQQGFYIDVGAYHPTTHSVTKIFYDQGWHGINIEPVPALFDEFPRERSRDINLPIALSSETGTATINILGDSGLSSIDAYSQAFAPEPYKSQCQVLEVPVSTLYAVIKAHAPASIDFIKIDVEGLEAQVIRGLALTELPTGLRPRIILLEVTLPNTRVDSPNRAECQSLLAEGGYQRFFFDGLNDYYCQEFDVFSCSAVALPPNVFDGLPVTPIAYQSLISSKTDIQRQLDVASQELDLRRAEIDSLKMHADETTQQLNKQLTLLRQEKLMFARQANDLKQEIHRLYGQYSDLVSKMDRAESKLLWLRARRAAYEKFLKSAMSSMAKAYALLSRLHGDR